MIPRKVLDEINRFMSEKRYGNLQINFVQGRIVNINRLESLKVEMLSSNQDMNINCITSQSIDIK